MRKIRKPRRTPEAPTVTPPRRFAAASLARFWRPHGWRLVLLWGLVLAAYSNSFQAGLVFDNGPVLLQDPRIRVATLHNVGQIFTEGYWHVIPTSGLYRPLTTLSYLFNYAVFGNGAHPEGYHWINLALHEINVALVYALGLLILGEPALGLALAAIWGVHPLLTESVTNIVGRADLLAAFGVLAGLWCYVRWASSEGRSRRWWLVGLVAAQTIGLFSKESAAVLPGILLLYDLAWTERGAWRARMPAYAALAVPFAAFIFARQQLQIRMLIGFSENPMVSADFWTARLTGVKVAGKLASLFFWPGPLSADYSYNAVPLFGWRLAQWQDFSALVAAVAFLTVLLFAWRRRHTNKALFFFGLSFFVAYAPTSNLVVLIGSIMAERFLYLPSIGLAACVVIALHAARTKWPGFARAGWIAAGLVCFIMAARTYARNSDWQDELSLWSSAVRVCPDAARSHMNLGRALLRIPGRVPDAIAEYQTALRIQPDSELTHYNLGVALSQSPGRLPEAIAEYRAALRIKPGYAVAHINLGVALSQSPERMEEALAEWREALKIEPNSAEAHNNLANALARMPGRLSEAVTEFQAALRSDPDFAEAHLNLGNALAQMPGRQAEAIAEWRAAIKSRPDLTEAHYNLANALSQIPERRQEAIAEYQATVRLDPSLAQAHNNLANALAQAAGRLPEAIGEWQAALRIQPDLAEAHANLGIALSQMPGRQADAMAELEAALRLRDNPQVRQVIERLRAGR